MKLYESIACNSGSMSFFYKIHKEVNIDLGIWRNMSYDDPVILMNSKIDKNIISLSLNSDRLQNYSRTSSVEALKSFKKFVASCHFLVYTIEEMFYGEIEHK